MFGRRGLAVAWALRDTLRQDIDVVGRIGAEFVGLIEVPTRLAVWSAIRETF